MKTIKLLQQLQKTFILKQDIEDLTQLIELLRKTFQEELSFIRQEIACEKDLQKINELISQANFLYKEYKESLLVIEQHIDKIDHFVRVHTKNI